MFAASTELAPITLWIEFHAISFRIWCVESSDEITSCTKYMNHIMLLGVAIATSFMLMFNVDNR